MRDGAAPPGVEAVPVEAGELGALEHRKVRLGHAVTGVVLGFVHADNVRRPRGGLAVREWLAGGLDVPGVVVPPLDPRPADPDGAGTR